MPVRRRSSHLDRILGRIEDLDSVNLTVLVQRLARERSLLETVFNTIQEGILVIRESGLIEYSNASANRLIGMRAEDVGHAILWKLVPELGRTLAGFFSKRGRARPSSVSREVEVTYPEHRYLRLYLVPFVESEASHDLNERFAVILSDITEHRLSVEEQIESERLQSIFQLAAGVAHEIGNPLNSINIHLQLMRRHAERLPDSNLRGKIDRAVAICAEEVQRLDGIITHFLHAIRPQEPDLRDVQLLKVLTGVLALQEEELKNRGVKLDLEVGEDPPVILGDPDQLSQVLFNVLKNAVEAMESGGGSIRISTRHDDEFVYLFIADTGQGIEKEDLARVFQPFFTSKKDGHGLGMMIAQRIMREHGGQIGIDSQPGVGTLLTLQFPQKHRRVRMLPVD